MPIIRDKALKQTPNSTTDLQFTCHDRVRNLDPKTNAHGSVRDPAPRASERRAMPQTMRSPTSNIKQGRAANDISRGNDQEQITGAESEERDRYSPIRTRSRSPAAETLTLGERERERERAKARREAAARSGRREGARRRKQSGKCERSQGRGGQKKIIQLFSLGRAPLSLVLLLFWDLSCGWTVLPSVYIRRFENGAGPAPVTGGTRRRIRPELRWKPPGLAPTDDTEYSFRLAPRDS
jgi:hypothetical protein